MVTRLVTEPFQGEIEDVFVLNCPIQQCVVRSAIQRYQSTERSILSTTEAFYVILHRI